MSFQQEAELDFPFPPHIVLSSDANFIEDDESDSSETHSSARSQDEESLLDARRAWGEVEGVTRKVGRFLIQRELEGLKRKADEVSRKFEVQHHSAKRRKVSQPSEVKEIEMLEKEGLVQRMERMRRLKSIFQTLNDAHTMLANEMKGMIENVRDEE